MNARDKSRITAFGKDSRGLRGMQESRRVHRPGIEPGSLNQKMLQQALHASLHIKERKTLIRIFLPQPLLDSPTHKGNARFLQISLRTFAKYKADFTKPAGQIARPVIVQNIF